MDFRTTHTTACDPVAKIPEFKVCAVKVEKLAAQIHLERGHV